MTNHNKKRNTAFLFQILTREIAQRSYKNQDKNQAIKVLKEYFAKGTELQKDLKCYLDILDTNNVSSRQAEKIISEVCKARSAKIDKKKLFNEQTKLLSELHNNITPEIFDNFVPDYRNMATVYQIFNDESTGKQKVLLEENVLHFMTKPKVIRESNKVQTLDSIEFNSFVDKFNEFYGDSLYSEQKRLLESYIFSEIDGGTSLKSYLNDEIGRLKKEVSSSLQIEEVQNDETMVEKTNQVLEFLTDLSKHEMTTETLSDIMKVQNLVREYENED